MAALGLRFVKIGIMAKCLASLMDQALTQPTATGQLSSGQFRAGWISPKNHPAQKKFRILPNYHMLYLVRGKGRLWDHHKQMSELHPGSRVDRHPNLPHTIERDPDGQWLEFFITLSPTLHRAMCDLGLITEHRMLSHVPVTAPLLNDCLNMVDFMHAHVTSADTISRMTALLAHFQTNTQRDDVAMTQVDQLHHATHLLTHMHHQQTTLPDIAKQVGMTYENFRKQFAKHFGKSPQQYRIDHRIEQAKHQLLETDINIDTLARQLGYNDVFCFSRQFKSVCGMCPTHFRQSSEQ